MIAQSPHHRFDKKRKRYDEPHRPLIGGGDPQQTIEDEMASDSTVVPCTGKNIKHLCREVFQVKDPLVETDKAGIPTTDVFKLCNL